VPYRGKRNEPAYVTHTVAKLAEARGLSAERLGAVITENARRCFSLPVAM
jgi:TatD DNase family protein